MVDVEPDLKFRLDPDLDSDLRMAEGSSTRLKLEHPFD